MTKFFLHTLLFFSCQSIEAVFDAYTAQQKVAQGDTSQAKKIYENMVVRNFTDWRALFNLGTLALNEKQYEEAVNDFEKVVELKPDNKEAQRRLAIARNMRDEQKQQQEQEKEQEQKDKDEQNKDEQEKQEENQNKEQKTQDQQDQHNKDKKNKQKNNEQSGSDDSQEKNEKDAEEKLQDKQKEQQEQRERKKQQQENAAANEADQERKKDEAQEKQQQDRQKEHAQKKAQQALPDKAAQQQLKADKRFSKHDAQILQELDKIDQQVQKEMVRYAIATAEKDGQKDHARKNW